MNNSSNVNNSSQSPRRNGLFIHPDERKQLLIELFKTLKQSPQFSRYSNEQLKASSIRAEQQCHDESRTREEYMQAMADKFARIRSVKTEQVSEHRPLYNGEYDRISPSNHSAAFTKPINGPGSTSQAIQRTHKQTNLGNRGFNSIITNNAMHDNMTNNIAYNKTMVHGKTIIQGKPQSQSYIKPGDPPYSKASNLSYSTPFNPSYVSNFPLANNLSFSKRKLEESNNTNSFHIQSRVGDQPLKKINVKEINIPDSVSYSNYRTINPESKRVYIGKEEAKMCDTKYSLFNFEQINRMRKIFHGKQSTEGIKEENTKPSGNNKIEKMPKREEEGINKEDIATKFTHFKAISLNEQDKSMVRSIMEQILPQLEEFRRVGKEYKIKVVVKNKSCFDKFRMLMKLMEKQILGLEENEFFLNADKIEKVKENLRECIDVLKKEIAKVNEKRKGGINYGACIKNAFAAIKKRKRKDSNFILKIRKHDDLSDE
ncbi:hypothetical protein TCON_1041 [Astathelohania contejeani]|uniref:Mediator complex subunit 15 KIX domain-containing protein n=1 Tax=Astathelohania contejeani TaxID=164912 RepID=A0ABQ7I014_9MICR|nr:hypothetical protein TCON_1041 [Thelohania contejeani]